MPLPLPKTSAPAERALRALGIKDLEDLTRHTREEVLKLHGMGPKAMRILVEAMDCAGLAFRTNDR